MPRGRSGARALDWARYEADRPAMIPRLPTRLRHAWERVRPLPRPQYVSPTPSVGAGAPPGVFQIPNVPTLSAAATSKEAACFVSDLIERMSPSDELAGQQAYYKLAGAQFGRHMRYADLTTTLWAACTLIKPSSFPRPAATSPLERSRTQRMLCCSSH